MKVLTIVTGHSRSSPRNVLRKSNNRAPLNTAARNTNDKSPPLKLESSILPYSESIKMASVYFNSLEVKCELQIFKRENIYQVDKVSAKDVSWENSFHQKTFYRHRS